MNTLLQFKKSLSFFVPFPTPTTEVQLNVKKEALMYSNRAHPEPRQPEGQGCHLAQS